MFDKQYIPLFVFVACLAIALALALFTNEWPTALAISLAGVALALSMRMPSAENHDTAFIEEDIRALREAGEQRDADLSDMRKLMDDLAEIVEAVASSAATASRTARPGETEGLREAVAAMEIRLEGLQEPQKQAAARIDNLENSVALLRQANVSGATPSEPLQAVGDSGGGRGGSIMDAAVARSEAATPLRAAPSPEITTDTVRRMPVLLPDSDMPVSAVIDDPSDVPSVRGALAVLRHGLEYSSSDAEPQTRLFVRLSTEAIRAGAVESAMLAMASDPGANLDRLAIMVPQAAIRDGIPDALETLLGAGCEMALEQMTDWSVDLVAMSGKGLRYILVDGPAMARSALAQKGDPTRLKSVLAARGITLIAANIENRMQLDAVNALVPDMISGSGLVEPILVDVA